MIDVLNRMVQLQYTSRLKLDKHFFDKVDGIRRPHRKESTRPCHRTAA